MNMTTTTKYEVDHVIKFAEVDDYEKGCDPATSTEQSYKMDFSADTPKELIHQLMKHVGTNDIEDVQINSCDEDGRIDIGAMEDGTGGTPTESQTEKWKKGEYKLWYIVYTFYIEKVTRETVAISIA